MMNDDMDLKQGSSLVKTRPYGECVKEEKIIKVEHWVDHFHANIPHTTEIKHVIKMEKNSVGADNSSKAPPFALDSMQFSESKQCVKEEMTSVVSDEESVGSARRSSFVTFDMRSDTGNPFDCQLCGKVFARESHLIRHARTHTGETPFECQLCGRRFTQKGHLNTHIRVHTGETPFKCLHCGRGFAVNGNLIVHMRTHTGETPFICQQCGKGFARKYDLIRHTHIHTGETPYKCQYCGKGFSQKGHLNTHISVHTGETKFKCHQCGKGFTRKKNLLKHSNTHTGETITHGCEL